MASQNINPESSAPSSAKGAGDELKMNSGSVSKRSDMKKLASCPNSKDFCFPTQIAKGTDGPDDEHGKERLSVSRKRELLQMDRDDNG